MSIQRVAVITGASQGIGAGVVSAYQDLDFAVVANSRAIAPVHGQNVDTVPGDIGDPEVADRVVRRSDASDASTRW